jgi:predicted aminopeptidase
VTLVDVVIHELVHQNVYVTGEIAFNETLASSISKRLTPAFFLARGETAEAADAERRYQLWLAQSGVFDEFAERLQLYFAEWMSGDRATLLAGRSQIYGELDSRLRALEAHQAPELETEAVTNNAVFLALWRYRKQASLIQGYLATFADMPAAVTDLRARAETDGDPYASLAVRLSEAVCCSGEKAVSSLGNKSSRDVTTAHATNEEGS